VSDVLAIPIEGLPELEPGDPLGGLVCDAAKVEAGDVVVVSQKAVSKVEGRIRRLGEVQPSAEAQELARRVGKQPALVQLILDESSTVVREAPGILIVETRGGWVCANAGIDSSNVPGDDAVTLLPEDADASARRLRAEIHAASGVAPAVVVSDSFGRPWRLGQAEVAIGCAGLEPLDDWSGRRDRDGAELVATAPAVADQLAATADLARDKASGVPAVIVRGLARLVTEHDGPGAAVLRRPAGRDLFR
jgi:coenzyme F420-0:L-glutamate ligase/coenzyme F420-1:gamma-L-glutamate ligase